MSGFGDPCAEMDTPADIIVASVSFELMDHRMNSCFGEPSSKPLDC